jgi:N-acetylglutamate synthase-like GNAT family acetyltransferase
MSAEPRIRRHLRPGDLGAILALHARLITDEHGLDSTHEGYVGASLTEHAIRGFPGEREGIWVVEHEGRVAGSIGLTDDGDEVASLRWLVVDPSLRGRGLGRRLVSELIAEAREKGFERIELETFSELRAAAHLYRIYGFELTGAETGPRWGRDEITYQRYELELRTTDGMEPAGLEPATSSVQGTRSPN